MARKEKKTAEKANDSVVTNTRAVAQPNGIKKIDSLLNDGFPSGSVILLAGSSGSGKTTFSFQWLFDGIESGENGMYITLTESPIKLVENLRLLDFYNEDDLKQHKLKILDMRDLIFEKELFNQRRLFEFIENEVKETKAKRLCIDSITAIAYNIQDKDRIRNFIFELGKLLSSLNCTTILISEIVNPKRLSAYGVEEFISDAIVKLEQIRIGGEPHRVMQVIKVRGRDYRGDDIPFKISKTGISFFPRMEIPLSYSSTTERISIGDKELDEMLGSGILKGASTLIVGPTGTGKSLLSMQFMMEGLRNGEICFYVGFEESRDQIVRNASGFGWNLEKYEQDGKLIMRCIYPTEKFLNEHLSDIRGIVESNKITRCVVDSLSSISHSYSDDQSISFAKTLNAYLKSQNITTFFTAASGAFTGSSVFSESHLSTMTDAIVMLRHVEFEGNLGQVINIIKVRGSSHSKELRRYTITSKGLIVGESLTGYEGVTSGITRKVSETVEEKIRKNFLNTLGPMGSQVFDEIKSRGITEQNISDYVNSIVKQGAIKEQAAKEFMERINLILKGETLPETNSGQNKPAQKQKKEKGLLNLFKSEKE